MAEANFSKLAISILCGGPSRRFRGKIKAKLEFRDSLMYELMWEKVQPYGDQIFLQIAGRHSYPYPHHRDKITGAGPLGGLHSSLNSARSKWVFLIASDLSFFDPHLIEILTENRDPMFEVILPRWENGYLEPLAALYRVSVLPWIEKLLAQNVFQISRLFQYPVHVRTVSVDYLINSGQIRPNCFANLNRPSQLRKLNRPAQLLTRKGLQSTP
ncbi:MAG: molybdenum cofactor guanylyltransferase [Candidatus Acetothermia bacterium]